MSEKDWRHVSRTPATGEVVGYYASSEFGKRGEQFRCIVSDADYRRAVARAKQKGRSNQTRAQALFDSLRATCGEQDETAVSRHHASKKKSPSQLDREVAAALRGSRGDQSDVMIVARPKDWRLIEESLRLDVESSAFDPVLRWKIQEALGALEVGSTYQGRGEKTVARARQKDWALLEETLQADAQSKRLAKHDREDLQAALKRLAVKPWPQ